MGGVRPHFCGQNLILNDFSKKKTVFLGNKTVRIYRILHNYYLGNIFFSNNEELNNSCKIGAIYYLKHDMFKKKAQFF